MMELYVFIDYLAWNYIIPIGTPLILIIIAIILLLKKDKIFMNPKKERME